MNFDEEIKNISSDSKLIQLDNFLIDNKSLNVLSKYDINPNNYKNLNSLIFMIENILNDYDLTDEEYDELDMVCKNLSEKNYYLYTNK